MPVFGTQMFGSGGPSTFSIDKSCIWNGVDAYMSRTPGSAGNRKTATQSMWVKRSKLSSDQAVGINTASITFDVGVVPHITNDLPDPGI